MPALVLVGAQWGDEGKGKATDQLGGSVDYVVKFNGGNNAGHTVVIGDETYALHLLPSGILSPGCTPVIGNGVVVDLAVLFEEIDALEARGVDCTRLLLSADGRADIPNRLSGAGDVQPLDALTRPLAMDEQGVAEETAPEPDRQVYAAPEPEPDVLADTRRDAVWWGLLGGGALLLALVLRPVLARRTGRS